MLYKQKKQKQILYASIGGFLLGFLLIILILNKGFFHDDITNLLQTDMELKTQSFKNAEQIWFKDVDAYIVFENTSTDPEIEKILVEIMQDPLMSPMRYYQPYKYLGGLGGQDWRKIYVIEKVNISMLARKYMRNPHVKYIEPKDTFVLGQNTHGGTNISKQPTQNIIMKNENTDDFFFEEQRYLNQYKYDYQTSLSCSSKYKKVYIIDNGFTNHEDINYSTEGYDIADKDADTRPPVIDSSRAHGTYIAGLVAAKSNNGIGIASASRASAYPIKATKDSSQNPDILTHACEGIAWSYREAKDNNESKRLVLLPASSRRISRTCKNMIDILTKEGMTLVSSAGNENIEYKKYPAALPDVLAVAASNQTEQKTQFSNHGSYIDITAPGKGIITTASDDLYEKIDGTSAAAALVTARIAAGYEKTVSMPDDRYYTSGKMGKGLIAYESCVGTTPTTPIPNPDPHPDTILGKIMKTSETKKAGPGEKIEYKIAYENISQETQDIKLIDELPSYMTFIDASIYPDDISNGQITRNISQLKPSEEVLIKFSVEILENRGPLNNGEMIVNCVTASTVDEPSCRTLPYVRSGDLEPTP